VPNRIPWGHLGGKAWTEHLDRHFGAMTTGMLTRRHQRTSYPQRARTRKVSWKGPWPRWWRDTSSPQTKQGAHCITQCARSGAGIIASRSFVGALSALRRALTRVARV